MSADTGIGPAGIAFLALLGAALPLGAWRTKVAIDAGEPLPGRVGFYLSVIATQVVLAGLAFATARFEGVVLAPGRADARALAAGAGLLALALATMLPFWRAAARRGDRRIALFAPRGRRERALWVATSLAAAFAEEVAYRGVLIALLARAGIGPEAAVLAAAAMFALAHLAQGWRAAPLVLAFAAGFHVLVAASGGLAVAIAVHALYDVIAGFASARLLRGA